MSPWSVYVTSAAGRSRLFLTFHLLVFSYWFGLLLETGHEKIAPSLPCTYILGSSISKRPDSWCRKMSRKHVCSALASIGVCERNFCEKELPVLHLLRCIVYSWWTITWESEKTVSRSCNVKCWHCDDDYTSVYRISIILELMNKSNPSTF